MAAEAYRVAAATYESISEAEAKRTVPAGTEIHVLESRSAGSRWERGETSLFVTFAVPAGADLTMMDELLHSTCESNWKKQLSTVEAYFWTGDDWIKASEM